MVEMFPSTEGVNNNCIIIVMSIHFQQTSQEPVMIKESEYYRVGDLVDGKSLYDGTWWEGKIVKIEPNPNIKESRDEGDDGFLYHFVDER